MASVERRSQRLGSGLLTLLPDSGLLARFDPARGSFLNYLRTCLDQYVVKQHEFAARQKRGGTAAILDFEQAERELAATPAASPEDVFFREWRGEVFARALDDLRRHAAASGRELPLRIFEQYDLADGDRPRYADLARQHEIAETAVVNYLAWARRELRRLVVERLKLVTAGPAELRGEIGAVFR